MWSQTWKSILQTSVTQVVKELKFNHLKHKENINRKNLVFKTTQKVANVSLYIAFSDCIFLLYSLEKKDWFTYVSKKYHSRFRLISWCASRFLN